MSMSVVYSNFCGMVVSETRGGVERDYVCDTLGSTIGLMDATGTMTDRWEYWPFGEVVSHTGTNPTPLTFLGVLGYFKDVLDKLFYVRARHLRVDLARWLTVDPLWPGQPGYCYATCSPTVHVDFTGTEPCSEDVDESCKARCSAKFERMVSCDMYHSNFMNILEWDNVVCVCDGKPKRGRKPKFGPPFKPVIIKLGSSARAACVGACLGASVAIDGFDLQGCIDGCPP